MLYWLLFKWLIGIFNNKPIALDGYKADLSHFDSVPDKTPTDNKEGNLKAILTLIRCIVKQITLDKDNKKSLEFS